MKERVMSFISTIKNNDDVIQESDVANYLKNKFHEYERMNITQLNKQAKEILDKAYFEKTGLNL